MSFLYEITDSYGKLQRCHQQRPTGLGRFLCHLVRPCETMHPVLEQLKANLGDRIRIIKVDVDKHGIPAAEYNVQVVPTLILFRSGKVLWRQSGAMPLNQLLQVVNQYL